MLVEKLLSAQDTTDVVDFIIETLNMHSLKKVGKTNRNCFSPFIMGLTMNQYLKGSNTYAQLKEDAVLVYPSIYTLKQKKCGQHVKEGNGVELY